MYVKEIKFKKDTIAALQYNIQMHYLGMEREDAQTSWSKEGALLSVIQLTARLIEILKMYKGKTVPERTGNNNAKTKAVASC